MTEISYFGLYNRNFGISPAYFGAKTAKKAVIAETDALLGKPLVSRVYISREPRRHLFGNPVPFYLEALIVGPSPKVLVRGLVE